MYTAVAYTAASKPSKLVTSAIPRRDPTELAVQIEIVCCGICHSDLHYARDEWHKVMPAVYPCVPGHEITGRVTKGGKHNITPHTEVIRIQKINESCERMVKSEGTVARQIDNQKR